MLSEAYPRDTLENILIPRESWRPYPTVAERDPWTSLPDAVRTAHLARGEEALGFEWPVLPATRFLEFARIGDRSNYQNIRGARRGALGSLVVAECLEGKGRFLDQIANGIWATCEETYWGVPAHLYMQKHGPGLPDIQDPTLDLFAGETLNLLAWTWYLLGDRLDAVSPLIRPRILREAQWRALTPCLARDDFWWMGLEIDPRYGHVHVNNWNPWVNSNWLTGALLLEHDPERRLDAVSKILKSLDVFIDSYHDDGGCDEGPGYWGRAAASLFDNLEILHSATDGAIDVYDDALIQNMGRFIYRAQIAGDYFVNFADASAIVTPTSALTYRYGKAIGDSGMMALGIWAAQQRTGEGRRGGGGSLGRLLPVIFSQDDLLSADAAPPLPRDVWLDGIQFFAARDRGGSSDGLYVAAKGGHNEESHNHNDVGNFIVYADGKPVLVDVGVETYTAKTFSPQRYEIWTMQSAYHNLPTVNGVMQHAGPDFAAKAVASKADDASALLSLDIAGAYPEDAGIRTWARTVTLVRGQEIVVTDAYDLTAVTGDLTLNLITPCDVEVGAQGLLHLKETTFGRDRITGSVQIHYDADKFSAEVEPVPITDSRLGGVWGEHLTRIALTAVNPPAQDTWTLRITQ